MYPILPPPCCVKGILSQGLVLEVSAQAEISKPGFRTWAAGLLIVNIIIGIKIAGTDTHRNEQPAGALMAMGSPSLLHSQHRMLLTVDVEHRWRRDWMWGEFSSSHNGSRRDGAQKAY